MSRIFRHATLKPDPLPAQWLEAAKSDIERLRCGLIAEGISADDVTIYEAWKRHSDGYAASWLVLYHSDVENVAALMPHLDIHEDRVNSLENENFGQALGSLGPVESEIGSDVVKRPG